MTSCQTRNQFVPDWVPPPGETIREVLAGIGLSQADLSRRMSRSTKFVNELVQGKASLDEETALQLERVLGVRAGFWLGLESDYQLLQARQKEAEKFCSLQQWVKAFPLKQMGTFGWIKKTTTNENVVQTILEFFGVADLSAWNTQWGGSRHCVSFRPSRTYEANPQAVAAWLRQGQRMAEEEHLAPFDRQELIRLLPEMRKLTTKKSVCDFKPQLESFCRQCGVVLLFVPELKGTTLSGAAHWHGGKPIIQLSLRHKTNDNMWFSFFHEVKHIISHPTKNIYINERLADTKEEQEADAFARDTLIPERAYASFLKVGHITLANIERFAQDIDTAPGIIVGRLQHEGKILRSVGNHLKVRYSWKTK